MSFKGLKKSIVRAPQNFRQKLNIGETTSDAVYIDAERRFKEIEIETKKLSDELKRYFSAVNGMLDFQIDFSKAIEEIYKPILGRLLDPNSAVPEDNPEGIKASEQYREVVKELKETLKPDLELIEKRIVEPAQQLLKVIQAIRKMATKREHKQVDLDRAKRNYKKYDDKKERTPKDEERMYAADGEVQIAQQEYDYYNEMLKGELPILFQMQSDFIKPLFVSFYYMQLNIFYTLYTRMDEMKIPYFDLDSDIVEAYNIKKGNIEEQADSIGITHFKMGHAKNKLEAVKRRQALMGVPVGQLQVQLLAQFMVVMALLPLDRVLWLLLMALHQEQFQELLRDNYLPMHQMHTVNSTVLTRRLHIHQPHLLHLLDMEHHKLHLQPMDRHKLHHQPMVPQLLLMVPQHHQRMLHQSLPQLHQLHQLHQLLHQHQLLQLPVLQSMTIAHRPRVI